MVRFWPALVNAAQTVLRAVYGLPRTVETMASNIHVVKKGSAWSVEEEGTGGQPIAQRPTRESAVEVAKKLAKSQKVELLVHREDGSIGERDSYGHDVPRNRG